MSAKKSSTATKAIGQRAMFHTHVNEPPRRARCAIASPSVPPSTISTSIPVMTSAAATTRTIEMIRSFQKGRVSVSS